MTKICWIDNYDKGLPDVFHVPVTEDGLKCQYCGKLKIDYPRDKDFYVYMYPSGFVKFSSLYKHE